MRDTLEMAREAKVTPDLVAAHGQFFTRIEHLVALVRADERERTWTQEHWTEHERSIVAVEREACWRLCDALWLEDKDAHDCREAIRARGNT